MRREDFKQEGEHRWVASDKGYTIVVQRTDGSYEIIIRETVTHDPTNDDWTHILQTVSRFYKELNLANWYSPKGDE